jgi:hypothetical protein
MNYIDRNFKIRGSSIAWYAKRFTKDYAVVICDIACGWIERMTIYAAR